MSRRGARHALDQTEAGVEDVVLLLDSKRPPWFPAAHRAHYLASTPVHDTLANDHGFYRRVDAHAEVVESLNSVATPPRPILPPLTSWITNC